MDGSPYTPGAGHRPPVLAGRGVLIQAWQTGLNDVAATGRQRAPDIILTAPRGVGKTATVLEFQDLSQRQGFEVVRLQAASGNAGLVDSLLRRARARAEDGSGPWQRAKRAFDRVSGVTLPIVGGGVSFNEGRPSPPPPARASPEDLADALATLAREVRKDHRGGGVLITVDEIQAADHSDLTLLAAALQGLNTEYPDAAVMFAASGLPQTFQELIRAGVTHPDRLFRFRPVPLVLEPEDARHAIVEAARRHDVAWEPEAADMIIETSRGYPAHLQVFADETWITAAGPTITVADAHAGIRAGADTLERESLGPRFDGLTDREREFLTALAVSGAETTTAGLAVTLGRTQQSLSQVRDALITKGDVYVPRRGELALTVPVFAPYLLANYESGRQRSSRSGLLPLEEMQSNWSAVLDSPQRRRSSALPQPGGARPRGARAELGNPSGHPGLPAPAAPFENPPPSRDIDL